MTAQSQALNKIAVMIDVWCPACWPRRKLGQGTSQAYCNPEESIIEGVFLNLLIFCQVTSVVWHFFLPI